MYLYKEVTGLTAYYPGFSLLECFDRSCYVVRRPGPSLEVSSTLSMLPCAINHEYKYTSTRYVRVRAPPLKYTKIRGTRPSWMGSRTMWTAGSREQGSRTYLRPTSASRAPSIIACIDQNARVSSCDLPGIYQVVAIILL